VGIKIFTSFAVRYYELRFLAFEPIFVKVLIVFRVSICRPTLMTVEHAMKYELIARVGPIDSRP